MESVVFEDSPLARYLEGEGDGEKEGDQAHDQDVSSALPSPSFAPRGRPTVQSRFRNKLSPPLRLSIPPNTAAAAFHNTCSKALTSRLGRSDNTRFLEQFRYIIVASQLLSEHSYHSQGGHLISHIETTAATAAPQLGAFTLTGVVLTAFTAFGLVWMIHWARGHPTKSRVALVVTILVALATLAYAYVRRQWLQYLRLHALTEASSFVAKAQGLDAATSATMTLIQEVELVSRGYRISAPLPPITRLEDRSQNRRCMRLRRTLHGCLVELFPRYNQAVFVLKPLTEQLDLEKYYDVYDISELDLQEASLGCAETEFEDKESLRALKILVARFYTIRKVFLCCLLALEADGGKPDFLRWSIAVDEIHGVAAVTGEAEERLRRILSEEESFPVPATPKIPLTPGRERWRSQLRKLNTLSTGIRGLQAKLHVLREESDKTLNESVDLSDVGPNLMLQYESIGLDLKALTQEWEDGKVALANTLERNEKRISSMSGGLLSPTTSLGGLTSVEEGSPADALKALNGEDTFRSSLELSSSDAEEVFEAIAIPRQRSTLTRDERIVKMKEERAKREIMRDKAEANTHMLRELESVINLRPRNRTAQAAQRMLEARLEQANLLKKVVDAIKDLVQDCNFDCNDSGIALQAMDNSHVALVSMMLKAEGFSPYRCDRNVALGVNLTSLTKVLRAAQNEDILTLKAEDAPDVLNLVFESSESDRLSEYDLKLMDIDQEHLGIPETEYAATISMPSSEFRRICADLMALSESVAIEASKDGVKFSCNGDIGNGAVTLRSHTNVEKPELNVDIELTEPVALTFSLKYLVNFCKASGLSSTVKLCLSNEVPLLVEYNLSGSSYLRFYLAPKIGDEE